MTTAAPVPVTIVVVPVRDGERVGLLVVRRNVPPGIGKLAFVSGFLEAEPWQVGAAREVREETGLAIDPATLEPMWFTSFESPNGHRLLLFALAAIVDVGVLAPHEDVEIQERGLVYGPDGLDEVFAYEHHALMARRYFAERGVTGPHDFAPR